MKLSQNEHFEDDGLIFHVAKQASDDEPDDMHTSAAQAGALNSDASTVQVPGPQQSRSVGSTSFFGKNSRSSSSISLPHLAPRVAPPVNMTYIAAIDQGTTSSRFIVFDVLGNIVALHQMEFSQIHSHAGWTEHNPMEILESVRTCMDKVVAEMQTKGQNPSLIKCVGITNQRETTFAWDSDTGMPLCNAIVWHDTRTQGIISKMTSRTPTQSRDYYSATTGLPLSTYFSASKMRWMLENVPAVEKARSAGTLRFGTVDSWLIYHLTGGPDGEGVHITDFTNASRTMLVNIKTRQWSDEMLKVFDIDRSTLPTILPSSHVYGHIEGGPLSGIPIAGCLGDQQSALVGQKCFNVGDAKNTYGTGCFMLYNTGNEPVASTHGMLTTAGYDIPALGDPTYALEGSVAVGGAAVKFLRDNLGLIKESAQISQYAAEVPHTGGVYFVPAFSGLFAPYWREDARGVLVGLTSYTDRRHICRAVLESVGFQTLDILNAMNADAGQDKALATLRVDGGLTNSDLCMSLQADVAGIPVNRPAMRETTALGAAIAAGLATDCLTVEQLSHMNATGLETFEPQTDAKERACRYRMWKKAVERTFGWIDTDESLDCKSTDEPLID